MEDSLILETTFLIDLEREIHRKKEGPAIEFLIEHENSRLYITFTIAGELAAGASLSDRIRWESFLEPFQILERTREVCWQYGQIYRYLQQNRNLIGTNDLWIAATAVAFTLPLVTRNAEHFKRVPNLELIRYKT
jgi:predicted nucleic acid-binding protein